MKKWITIPLIIALLLFGNTAMAKGGSFGESDSATHVTQSIGLPISGYYGSTMVWVSNTTSILSNNGTLLTRPAHGTGDVTVTLTAYISNNGIADSKTFQVIVKQLP